MKVSELKAFLAPFHDDQEVLVQAEVVEDYENGTEHETVQCRIVKARSVWHEPPKGPWFIELDLDMSEPGLERVAAWLDGKGELE